MQFHGAEEFDLEVAVHAGMKEAENTGEDDIPAAAALEAHNRENQSQVQRRADGRTATPPATTQSAAGGPSAALASANSGSAAAAGSDSTTPPALAARRRRPRVLVVEGQSHVLWQACASTCARVHLSVVVPCVCMLFQIPLPTASF